MTVDEARSLGSAIRATRLERGLSQLKLAGAIGVSGGGGSSASGNGATSPPPEAGTPTHRQSRGTSSRRSPPPWTAPLTPSPIAQSSAPTPGFSTASNPSDLHALLSPAGSTTSPTPKPTESQTSSSDSSPPATCTNQACQGAALQSPPWTSCWTQSATQPIKQGRGCSSSSCAGTAPSSASRTSTRPPTVPTETLSPNSETIARRSYSEISAELPADTDTAPTANPVTEPAAPWPSGTTSSRSLRRLRAEENRELPGRGSPAASQVESHVRHAGTGIQRAAPTCHGNGTDGNPASDQG